MVHPRKAPPPSDRSNMLYGIREIAEFIRRTPRTTIKYIHHDGLPAAKTPQGVWFTHKALILQWIMAGHEAELNALGLLEPGWLSVVEEGLKSTAERHGDVDKHRRALRISEGATADED